MLARSRECVWVSQRSRHGQRFACRPSCVHGSRHAEQVDTPVVLKGGPARPANTERVLTGSQASTSQQASQPEPQAPSPQQLRSERDPKRTRPPASPTEIQPPERPQNRYLIFAENNSAQARLVVSNELLSQGQCELLAPSDQDVARTLQVIHEVQQILARADPDIQLLVKVVCSPDADNESPYFSEDPAEFALLFHIVCCSAARLEDHLQHGLSQAYTLEPDYSMLSATYLRLSSKRQGEAREQWRRQRTFSARAMQELATHGLVQIGTASKSASIAAARVSALVTDALTLLRGLDAVLAIRRIPGTRSAGSARRGAGGNQGKGAVEPLPPRTVFTLMLALGMDVDLHASQLPMLVKLLEQHKQRQQQGSGNATSQQGKVMGISADDTLQPQSECTMQSSGSVATSAQQSKGIRLRLVAPQDLPPSEHVPSNA